MAKGTKTGVCNKGGSSTATARVQFLVCSPASTGLRRSPSAPPIAKEAQSEGFPISACNAAPTEPTVVPKQAQLRRQLQLLVSKIDEGH